VFSALFFNFNRTAPADSEGNNHLHPTAFGQPPSAVNSNTGQTREMVSGTYSLNSGASPVWNTNNRIAGSYKTSIQGSD